MSQEQDRIRLAEAMGRLRCDCGDVGYHIVADEDGDPMQEQCEFCYTHPDSVFNFSPFTSPDDDYAVLEWARDRWYPNETPKRQWPGFALSIAAGAHYKVGDYARAALTVLGDQ